MAKTKKVSKKDNSNPFSFGRRINRATYWTGILLIIGGWLLLTVMFLTLLAREDFFWSIVVGVLFLIYLIPAFIWSIILIKQRCNDISPQNSIILTLVAIFVSPCNIIIGFLPGEKGPSKYGPMPKSGVKF